MLIAEDPTVNVERRDQPHIDNTSNRNSTSLQRIASYRAPLPPRLARRTLVYRMAIKKATDGRSCILHQLCKQTKTLRPQGRRVCLLDTVFLLESINTTASIQEFLLTCEERMTVRANLYTKIWFYRTCFKRITASTSNCSNVIFRLNILFHCSFHLFPP